MKLTLWQRCDHAARNLSPFALTFLVILAGMLPVRLPDLAPVVPALTLAAVFYWVVHRPDLMPVWVVFSIGVFSDLLTGGLTGVGALALLFVCGAVALQRRSFASGSFVVLWGGFAAVAAGAMLLQWLLHCLLLGVVLDPKPAAFQYFTTVAAYPCLAWLFAQTQRAVLR